MMAQAEQERIATRDVYRDVWVYVQREGDKLSREALELIAAGRKVADKLGQKLVAVMLGYKLGQLPSMCLQYGADSVIYADAEELSDSLNKKYVVFWARLAGERKLYPFFFEEEGLGRALAQRLAYGLKTGRAT